MAAGIATVKFNERDLRRIRKQFSDFPGAMPKVMSRAINKTAMSARTKAAREIAGVIKVKIGRVRKAIGIKKASYGVWRADVGVDWKGERIPLINFGARQTKSGVSYQINPKTGRKTIAGTFITTVRTLWNKDTKGHRGVFMRRGKASHPIDQYFGPSIGRVFAGSSEIIRRVTGEANKNLSKNIDVQVALILKKLKRGAG